MFVLNIGILRHMSCLETHFSPQLAPIPLVFDLKGEGEQGNIVEGKEGTIYICSLFLAEHQVEHKAS